MKTMKPLSKADLADIKCTIDMEGATFPFAKEFKALFDAEQYWREAVKKTAMASAALGSIADALGECPVCGGSEDYGERGDIIHAADCPWVLAQLFCP